MYHLDSILVFGGFCEARAQLQKNAQIIATHDPIAVRVDLQAPTQAVHVQWWRVNGIRFVLQLTKTIYGKRARIVLWHDLACKLIVAIYSYIK
jgi:hypothetical protein